MDKKKKFNRSICFHGTQSIREMLKGKCDRKESQSRKRNNLLEGEPLSWNVTYEIPFSLRFCKLRKQMFECARARRCTHTC